MMDGKRIAMWILAGWAVAVVMVACEGASSGSCEQTAVNGHDYCVASGPITETGFDCPSSHPNRHRAGDIVICSKEKEMPAEDRKQIERRHGDGTIGEEPPSGDVDGEGDAGGADAGCPPMDTAGSSAETGVYRQVDDRETNYICPDEVKPGASGTFTCVKEGTETRYRCEVVGGEGPDNTRVDCERADQCEYRWQPVCDDFNKYNDRESENTKNCWDPPQYYCSDGGGAAVTWFCKPDGSVCCVSAGTCARCDWLKVRSKTSCHVSGELQPKSESFCREFWSTIEEPYKSCIQGDCSSAEREQIEEESACEGFEPVGSIRICR